MSEYDDKMRDLSAYAHELASQPDPPPQAAADPSTRSGRKPTTPLGSISIGVVCLIAFGLIAALIYHSSGRSLDLQKRGVEVEASISPNYVRMGGKRPTVYADATYVTSGNVSYTTRISVASYDNASDPQFAYYVSHNTYPVIYDPLHPSYALDNYHHWVNRAPFAHDRDSLLSVFAIFSLFPLFLIGRGVRAYLQQR